MEEWMDTALSLCAISLKPN